MSDRSMSFAGCVRLLERTRAEDVPSVLLFFKDEGIRFDELEEFIERDTAHTIKPATLERFLHAAMPKRYRDQGRPVLPEKLARLRNGGPGVLRTLNLN